MPCSFAQDGTHFLWDQLGISDRKLVADFFIVFSRFEYALKRGGYLGTYSNGGAKPDWDQFAQANRTKFDCSCSKWHRDAVAHLLAHSPGLQVKGVGGALTYEPKPLRGNSDLERVVDAIKRVRNNLFHGGKFPSGSVSDPARDSDLLQHSLRVLEVAVELNQEVKSAFMASEDSAGGENGD